MIRLEYTGEFYCLENIGVKLPEAQIANTNINLNHICETSFAQEVTAWSIKILQVQKSRVPSQNTEYEVKDFRNK